MWLHKCGAANFVPFFSGTPCIIMIIIIIIIIIIIKLI